MAQDSGIFPETSGRLIRKGYLVVIPPKLKRGLAIGCGLLFLSFMLLFGGIVYFANQMGKEYKVVKGLEEQLAELHGPSNRLPAGFTGLPQPGRVQAFLAVREASAEWRQKLESSISELMPPEAESQGSGFRHFLRVMKVSRELAPIFSGFWVSRNQALLDNEMGMGEYIYFYCLGYHAWLGHHPADGALGASSLLSGLGATGPMVSSDDQRPDQEQRRRWAVSQENRLVLPLLKEAAREASTSGDLEQLTWAEQLQAEIRAMGDDTLRVLFADGVPSPLAELLEPYRGRLEAAYSVTVNPVELLFEDTWEDPE